jgi:hypothetical protein
MSPLVDMSHANEGLLPVGYAYPHLFRRVCLATYYPPFRARIIEAKTKAADRGWHYWSEHGYRSIPLQNQLHAAHVGAAAAFAAAEKTGDQVAIAAARVHLKAHGKAAPGGYSSHNFGLGDDSTHDNNLSAQGLQPDWDPKNYDVLGEELARVGLVWGKSFGDLPHANFAGYVSGAELAPLLKVWNACPSGMPDDERLRSVWAHLDAHAPIALPYYPPKEG